VKKKVNDDVNYSLGGNFSSKILKCNNILPFFLFSCAGLADGMQRRIFVSCVAEKLAVIMDEMELYFLLCKKKYIK
jgi:hypothetical protein